jgi:hypothetical protein
VTLTPSVCFSYSSFFFPFFSFVAADADCSPLAFPCCPFFAPSLIRPRSPRRSPCSLAMKRASCPTLICPLSALICLAGDKEGCLSCCLWFKFLLHSVLSLFLFSLVCFADRSPPSGSSLPSLCLFAPVCLSRWRQRGCLARPFVCPCSLVMKRVASLLPPLVRVSSVCLAFCVCYVFVFPLAFLTGLC